MVQILDQECPATINMDIPTPILTPKPSWYMQTDGKLLAENGMCFRDAMDANRERPACFPSLLYAAPFCLLPNLGLGLTLLAPVPFTSGPPPSSSSFT